MTKTFDIWDSAIRLRLTTVFWFLCCGWSKVRAGSKVNLRLGAFGSILIQIKFSVYVDKFMTFKGVDEKLYRLITPKINTAVNLKLTYQLCFCCSWWYCCCCCCCCCYCCCCCCHLLSFRLKCMMNIKQRSPFSGDKGLQPIPNPDSPFFTVQDTTFTISNLIEI